MLPIVATLVVMAVNILAKEAKKKVKSKAKK